jgi:AcrR family transcriptional regulator
VNDKDTAARPGPARTPRRAGRPRNEAANRAILEATLAILAEDGFEAMSISKVAARAGVSKPTVYLRWPNSIELVVEAFVRLHPFGQEEPEDSGDEDLASRIARMIGELAGSSLGRALPAIFAALARHPELNAEFRRHALEPRRATIRGLLEEAVRDGRLSPDLDLEIAVDVVTGPLFYRWFATGEPPDEATGLRITRLALRALTA